MRSVDVIVEMDTRPVARSMLRKLADRGAELWWRLGPHWMWVETSGEWLLVRDLLVAEVDVTVVFRDGKDVVCEGEV